MKIPIASPLFGFEEWDFEETDTIAIIKKTLGEILEGNPSDYLLIFGGKILDEETELKELDFKKTPFIYIYIPHEEEEEDNDEFTLPNELGQLPEIMILQRLISNGFPIPGPDYFLDNRDNVIGFINNVVNTIQQIAPELERFVTDPEILARFFATRDCDTTLMVIIIKNSSSFCFIKKGKNQQSFMETYIFSMGPSEEIFFVQNSNFT